MSLVLSLPLAAAPFLFREGRSHVVVDVEGGVVLCMVGVEVDHDQDRVGAFWWFLDQTSSESLVSFSDSWRSSSRLGGPGEWR